MLISSRNKLLRKKGFTLIEVLITIVVISIAATAIMGVYINTVQTSANPLIQQQAVSIAEAYMEEIISKSFADPTGVEGESRDAFDDIDDYDGLIDVGAKDQNNSAISGLEAYTVNVSVTAQSLSGAATIASTDSMRIDITVTHAAIDPIMLSGFRTNH